VTVCKVWDADYPWDIRVEKVCRSLRQEHDVHLVSRNSRRRHRYERYDGIHVHRLPALPWLPRRANGIIGFPAFFNPLWIRAIWQTARTSAAGLLMVRDLPLALTALLVARARKVPLILDMAENYPAMMQDLWDSGRFRVGNLAVRNPRVVRLVERISVRQADHILVVVDESKERLVRMGVPASKITVVMNTPAVHRVDGHAAEGEPPIGRPRDELVLVYLGILEVPRGLGTVIEALGEVRHLRPRVRLVVIGSGRDEGYFRDEARRLGVSDRVEFRGWVEHEQALACVAQCDVGLVPHHATESWQTTMPNKLFDYMAMGKPVIVSSARPTERIVTSERCGVVFEDRDASALAEAIASVADRGVREDYGRRGREAVRRTYNWEADERRLRGAVRRVAGAARPLATAGEGSS
jgi:glycosyltransferase involved in cell wall biosynthesis